MTDEISDTKGEAEVNVLHEILESTEDPFDDLAAELNNEDKKTGKRKPSVPQTRARSAALSSANKSKQQVKAVPKATKVVKKPSKASAAPAQQTHAKKATAGTTVAVKAVAVAKKQEAKTVPNKAAKPSKPAAQTEKLIKHQSAVKVVATAAAEQTPNVTKKGKIGKVIKKTAPKLAPAAVNVQADSGSTATTPIAKTAAKPLVSTGKAPRVVIKQEKPDTHQVVKVPKKTASAEVPQAKVHAVDDAKPVKDSPRSHTEETFVRPRVTDVQDEAADAGNAVQEYDTRKHASF